MKPRKVVSIVILILLVIIASSLFFMEKRKVSASACSICGREIHSAWAFTVTLNNGKKETLCCAKCGLLAMMDQKSKITSGIARDFNTGKQLSPENASYVWASDVDHCPMPKKSDWTDKQPMQLAWDRCIPSLIPFGTREAAETFQKEHGGRVINYSEAVQLIQSPPAQ